MECHPFDAENYKPDGEFDSVPGRKLAQGAYLVKVTITHARVPLNGWYRLNNPSDEVGVFHLAGPYQN